MRVHQTNRGVANRLMSLLDEKGRIALDERQCKILEIIGRFDVDKHEIHIF